jgi:hypothetical protein
VLTVSGNTVTQSSTGRTLIYSGNAADTGSLALLTGQLNTLKVTGDVSQNVDTNRAFDNAEPISGSNAAAQVIFREKVSIGNGGLSGVTLTMTYGDANTANTANTTSAMDALLAKAKTHLKDAAGNKGSNAVFNTTVGGNGNNNIQINKSVIIDSLTGNLITTSNDFSSSQFLKARDVAYSYNSLVSDKYVIGVASFSDGGVNVKVNRKPIEVGFIASNKVFDRNNVATVSGSSNEVIPGDLVQFTHTSATFEDANVGDNKLVTIAGIGLAGIDGDNYVVSNANFEGIARANITLTSPVTPQEPSIPGGGGGTGGGSVAPFGNSNPFELASASELLESDVCSVDNLAACSCEEAKDEQGKPLAGLNVCSPEKQRTQIQ